MLHTTNFWSGWGLCIIGLFSPWETWQTFTMDACFVKKLEHVGADLWAYLGADDIYIYIHIHIHTHTHIYIYTRTHTQIYASMFKCVGVCPNLLFMRL